MGSSSDDKPRRVTYVGIYNLSLLSEELYAAFPDWVVSDPIYGQRGLGKVQTTTDGVRITFPRATPKALVDVIVAAHDYTKLSKNEKNKKEKKKLRKDGKKKLRDLGLTQAEIGALIGANDI